MITHTSKNSKLVAAAGKSAKISIAMQPWGYSVRTKEKASFWAVVTQALAGGTAFVAAVVAVGIWVFPGSNVSADVAPFKMAFSGILGLISILALWFASQGTAYELQVDSDHKELREVLRNKKGQSFVLRRVGFNEISSVVFQRDEEQALHEYAKLIVRLKSQPNGIHLVFDKIARLEDLRDVLAQDILGGGTERVKTAAVRPRRAVKANRAKSDGDFAIAGE
jgi:hypothetical protein